MVEEARPLVSVIVPSYNVERYIDQTLESIENQTLYNIEILCVNDGSRDSTLDIMRNHASVDSRIRVIDKQNAGYGAACNTGIDQAHGAWIAIVEPDDWILPTMFEDMLRYAESFDATIDIIKTPYYRIVDPDTPAQRALNCSYKGRVRPSEQPFTIASKRVEHLLIHHPSIWSALYRADFLRDCGIRFHEIPGAGWADNPFLVETMCQARAIVYLDRAYYCYREETDEKTDSFVRGNSTVPFERWHDMMDVLERLGTKDEEVLRAQYRRGFTYLDYVGGVSGLKDQTLRPIMAGMFSRMQDDIVLSEPNISPAWKSCYRTMKGLEPKRENPLPYTAALVGAGVYSIQNVGPHEALKLVGAVAKRDQNARDIDTADSKSPQSAEDDNEQIDGDSSSCTNNEETRVPTADITISIVVPVFNSAAYLHDCFESLDRQTFKAIEVICIDDGSTDESPRMLADQASRDSRFKVVTQKNAGPSAARNAGIQRATGDYIVFLDADDLLEADACMRIAQAIAAERYDAVVFGWTCFPETEATDEWLKSRVNTAYTSFRAFTPNLLFMQRTHPFLRVAIRQDVLADRRIRFDEMLRVGEDCSFLFRLFPRIESTLLIPDELYRYRMPHEGSIMSSSLDGTPGKCVDDICMLASILDDWDHAGLLDELAGPLMHWFVTSFLYTILRQPLPVRNDLVALVKQLWLAHLSPSEIEGLPTPSHDKLLISAILDASDNGAIDMTEPALTRLLLAWRIAEYGPLDLATTAFTRLSKHES